MGKRRIVVTGLGAITPLGNSVTTTWSNILAGKSGISPIEHFDASEFPTRFAGTIKGLDISQYINSKDAKKMDGFIQYGLAASIQAVEDANLVSDSLDFTRVGVAVGSGIGGLGLIEATHTKLLKSGPKRVSPFFIPGSIINMISGHVAIRYGFEGPNFAITTACTTGLHNIGYSARAIAYGDADVMIAGGAEQSCTPSGMAGFAAARALSTRNDAPEKASRPWDKKRDGFVLSDGAAVIVLEEYEHAKARGAKIYAELQGFGVSCDAFHITTPREGGAGFAVAMKNAVHDAGVSFESVDYINAHGTSTPIGDVSESQAVETLFGESAKRLVISSTKSMTGHLLGAAGSVEAIFAILAIRDQVAPPTINLEEVDEDCRLDYAPNVSRPMSIQNTLSNSYGFGGTNGSLLFSKL